MLIPFTRNTYRRVRPGDYLLDFDEFEGECQLTQYVRCIKYYPKLKKRAGQEWCIELRKCSTGSVYLVSRTWLLKDPGTLFLLNKREVEQMRVLHAMGVLDVKTILHFVHDVTIFSEHVRDTFGI